MSDPFRKLKQIYLHIGVSPSVEGVRETVASKQNLAGLDIYSGKIHHTRAVLRLVWPFDGIAQKHKLSYIID